MAVTSIGRRERLPAVSALRIPRTAPPRADEPELIEAEVDAFLEAPLRERTEVEKIQFCTVLREHMRRFAELQACSDGASRREDELRMEIAELRQTLADLTTNLDKQRAGARQAQYLARHDSLTGLANRAYFRDCLEAKLSLAQQHGQTMAMMYVDVDNFKSINDTFGHAIGDAVLCIVSARLCRVLRAEDVVGRVGGDEFVCLLTGFQSRQQIEHTAQKVIETVAATERVAGVDVNVIVSIGIALYPQNSLSGERLLAQADSAMYYSKKRRAGYAFYDELPAAP